MPRIRKPKLQVGAKVKVLSHVWGHKYKIGEVVTVYDIYLMYDNSDEHGEFKLSCVSDTGVSQVLPSSAVKVISSK